MTGIELFSFEGCPFAQRTRMVLIEKGLTFRLVEVDLFDRPDWFADISPYGKVPVLRHDGGTVYESRIINEYLEEAFPDPALMPTAPLARARTRIWIDYCDARLLPAISRLTTRPGDTDQGREAREAVIECLRFLEHEAWQDTSGPFLAGRHPGLADLHFAPFLERFPVYEQAAGPCWPQESARLRDWLEALQRTEGWRGTALSIDRHIALQQQLRDTIARRKAAGAA